MGLNIKVHSVHWKRSWRIIPTRYPEVDLYARIAEPVDIPALKIIEEITNDRSRHERREINLLRDGDYFHINCSIDIKAAFSYLNPDGSRFSDGSYGVYYTASTLETAIRESAFHRAKFMARTKEKRQSLQMRVLRSQIEAECVDIRGMKKQLAAIYSPTHYGASQKFGRRHWSEGAQGIVYDTVRHAKGECAAIFSPQTISHCHQDRCLLFEWNGKAISKIYSIEEFPRF